MRKSIYLLTTTPSSHTHRFYPLSKIVIHTLNFAVLFLQHPYFCSFCTFLFQYFFVIFSLSIRANTGVPRQPYKGCTYCFIHEEAHTNVRFISCDGHQLHERGVDLEVEGMHYIDVHRGPAAYVLGPPPSRGRDLELEGVVKACHVEYVYESRDSHVRGTE